MSYDYDRRTAASTWKAKKVTDSDLKSKVELYWSPRQQAYDPTMMGNSSARTLAPLLFDSFVFEAASDFYFSRWNKDQAQAIAQLIQNSGHPDASNISRVVELSIFSSHGGSQMPSQYWDARYSGRLKDLKQYVPQLKKLGMDDASKMVAAYLKNVEEIREATESMIEKSVMSGLKKLKIPPALIGTPDR